MFDRLSCGAFQMELEIGLTIFVKILTLKTFSSRVYFILYIRKIDLVLHAESISLNGNIEFQFKLKYKPFCLIDYKL